MIRTQIQLTEEQARVLRSISASEGVSLAEIIRRSIDFYAGVRSQGSRDEKRRRALAVVGRYASDASDVSAEHDRYLAEIYGGGVDENLR